MATQFGTFGNDTLKGGGGDDTLVGLGGDDWLFGEGGDDILLGGSGDDFLLGDTNGPGGDDVLHGEGGNDRLLGHGGADELYGGADNDWLDGGDGADDLHGGAGNDRIIGGAGDDLIVGLDGSDSIDGGEGYDTLDASGVVSANPYGIHIITTTDDGGYHNYATAESGSLKGVEKVIGTAYHDLVFAGPGNDWFEGGGGGDHFAGGAGADYFWGGPGIDTASYSSASSGVTVALQSYNSNGTGDAKGDAILQVETLDGSNFADDLTGDTQDNVIRGNGGNDVIDPRTGSDTVWGGTGADTFVFVESYTVRHYGSSNTYTDRGDDVIRDYEAGVDAIELRGYAPDEVSVEDSGADAIVHAGWYVDIRVVGAAGQLDIGDILLA